MNDFSTNIKFAWKYAKNQKGKIIGFMICNFFHILISIVVPILTAKIMVYLTDNELIQVLMVALVLFFVEISRNVISYLCRYFSQVTYRETFTKLQLDLGRSILKLQNSSIDANSSGVFIQRLTTDTSKMADVFNLVNYHLLDILTNIGIFAAVLIIDYRVFVYLFIMVLIIGLVERKRISLVNERDKEFRKKNENVSGFVGELVRGVRDIKMLSAEKSFLGELHTKLVALNKDRYDMTKISREYNFLTGSLRDFLDLSMICILVYLIYIGDISIAVALVVYNYMGRVTHIVDSYSFLLEGLKDFNLSTSRESFQKKSLVKNILKRLKVILNLKMYLLNIIKMNPYYLIYHLK